MDGEYDVIICGSGLKECLLFGMLVANDKKVLLVDRNEHPGGESESLGLEALWQKFRPGEELPEGYGTDRDWFVDLIPKFVVACGKTVKVLLHTRVTRFLEWKSVDGTLVYQFQQGGFMSKAKMFHTVPETSAAVLKSPLMGLLEKSRAKNFYQFATNWDPTKQETWQGLDPWKNSMTQVFEKFGLQPNTVDFIGHAVAMYPTDEFLNEPYGEAMDRIKSYLHSASVYETSPLIYPIYGLSAVYEGFSRLAAECEATWLTGQAFDGFVYDANGKVTGVASGKSIAKCKMVICDPSYTDPDKPKITSVGKVIRAICILGAPIPDTGGASSCQIIFTGKQLNRKNDVYLAMVSWGHCIACKDKYVATISTVAETDNPVAELQPALEVLGPIEHQYMTLSDIFVPLDDGTHDNVYVTSSYDSTCHFESISDDVLGIWSRMMGSELDLTITANPEELQE
mmetsp:Transcript_58289/g.155785  ORF Transcript_58289/g.155785 Transcript_58289/m.155785 type:complete len:455 (+) Transcript_58289:24-1388(+)